VIELAFLSSPPADTLDLLDQASPFLGAAIRSSTYRRQLRALLTQSQQLTEELQTQQEELRVSNEELSERTHSLQEIQLKLESQHAELEQTNAQLEEQAQQLENQNNSLRHAQAEVERKAQELLTSSRYKSEFLANMSHELRTPLNSTLILAKLLRDNPHGNLSAEQIEFASTIYSAGNDLLMLINDILDLSKVEAGQLQIEPEKFTIEKLATGLDRIFRPQTQDKHLELVIQQSPGIPKSIETDRHRLEQILRN
jgi:signal transduction histidine kinase